MPPSVSPAAIINARSDTEQKILEAGRLLAQFGSFGLVWMRRDLTVDTTFGRMVEFVAPGLPVTDSILPLIGLEQEIASLREMPDRVLELPAVAVASGAHQHGKLNFTFFWNVERDCPMALAYKSASQTEIEVELSKQIRARLIAEAEVTAKSKELARANLDLESFAAIISHDLKAPLRHMRQLTELAFDHAGGPTAAPLRELLRDIESQSRRMSHMLTALLDYSSIGRKYEAIESVDTQALIEAVRDSLPESEHQIWISGTWPVLATLRAPLDLVLRNLVCNALQHHDRSTGKISVSCNDHLDHVAIRVTDDGPGINPHHHASIFLPFRTLRPDADHASTGMGLAAVKKTVESAGGQISVISDPSASRGTIFEVKWPKVLPD